MGRQMQVFKLTNYFALALGTWLLAQPVAASTAEPAGAAVSFAALQAAGSGNPAPVEALNAEDGTRLAYRSYAPRKPQAVLVFFHGDGAHSGAGYAHLARALSERYAIAVITPDLRGHGESDGSRGDAPKPAAVWDDISSMVALAQERFPDLPVFLGGHSSGAGLVLNYLAYPRHDAIDGVVMLAPELGPFADTHRAGSRPFAKTQNSRLLVNALTGGKAFGSAPAVTFDYPLEALLKDQKLLTGYTVNMANAVMPRKPAEMLAEVKVPLAMWVGAEDEIIDPLKLATLLYVPGRDRVAEAVNGATHQSLLLRAADSVGPWLQQQATAVVH